MRLIRHTLLALTGLPILLVLTSGTAVAAGSAVTCSTTASPVVVRTESHTEQIADLNLECTSTYPSAVTPNATLSLSQTVTSLALNGTTTEAAAIVTPESAGPESPVLGTVSTNSVSFSGISIPVGNSVLTFTNIRIDATSLTAGATVTAAISFSGSAAVDPSPASGITMATAENGLGTQTITGVQNFPVDGATSAASPAFTLNFGEGASNDTAFKTQGGSNNSALDSWQTNNTETGYYVSVPGLPVNNTASAGTRIRVVFQNLPANETIYMPLTITSNQLLASGAPAGFATLTAGETGAYTEPSPSSNPLGYTGPAGSLVQLTVTSGQAEAVYEILQDSPTTVETYTVNVYLAAPPDVVPVSTTPVTATISFAPVVTSFTAGSPPLPAFVQTSESAPLNGSAFPTALVIDTSSLPTGEQGASYSTNLTYGNAVGAVTWTNPGNNLPAGLALSSTGTLSGAATVNGTFTGIVFQAADSDGGVQQTTLSITIVGPLAISTTLLPTAIQNQAYAATLVATGGSGSYQWHPVSLPSGLSLSSAGNLTGTVTGAGQQTVSVNVTDSLAGSANQSFTFFVNVNSKVITSGLPAGLAIVNIGGTQDGAADYSGPDQIYWQAPFSTVSAPIAYTFQPGTYTFRVIDPADAESIFPSLATTDLPGTSNTQASAIGTAWAFDSSLPWATAYLAFDSSALTNRSVNQLFSGAETCNTPDTCSYPTGASLAQTAYNNAIGGGFFNELFVGARNASPVTQYTFAAPETLIFVVPDNDLSDNSGSVSVLIAPLAANPLSIETTSLPGGQAGTAYSSYTIVPFGGSGYYSWSSITLPPGLALSAAGVLSGTPTTPGTYSGVVITVTDPVSGFSASKTYTIAIAAPLTITTTSPLPSGIQSNSYSQSIVGSGGSGAYTWSTSGDVPPGLSINSGTGLLSGTPTTPSTYSFTVMLQDTSGDSTSQIFSLVIGPPFGITTSSLPNGAQGNSYNQMLAAVDPSGSITWSVTSGTLPAGLTLNSSTGLIAGTPTTIGSFTFTVNAADSASHSSAVTLTLTIVQSQEISYVEIYDGSPGLIRVSADGSSVSTIAGSVSGNDVAQDASANFIVATVGSLVRVTPSGSASTIANAPSGSAWLAVAVDGNGNYIVGDNERHELWFVSPDGKILRPIAAYPVTEPTELEDIKIAIDVHGNYIVAEDNWATTPLASVFRITPAGVVSQVTLTGGVLPEDVFGLTLDQNGNYILEDGYRETLFQITPAGATTVLASSILGFGLARNPLSNVFVTGQTGYLLEAGPGGTVSTYPAATGATSFPNGLIAVTSDFVSTVDATSPVAYFRLENTSGVSEVNSYTYDFSSTGSAVQSTASPPITEPNTGYAQLDGNSGTVTTGLSGQLNAAGSMMAWVNLAQLPSASDQTFRYVVGESESGNDFDLQFQNNSGNTLNFYTAGGSDLTYTPSASTLVGQWHMIVATFDATVPERSIYWDGTLVATDNGSSNTNKEGVFEIGESSIFGARYFDGGIAEAAVWNYALNAGEVYRMYASGAANYGSPTSAPVITLLTPSTSGLGSSVSLTITGTDLNGTTGVWWTPVGGETTVISPSTVSPTQVAATIPSGLLTSAVMAQVALVGSTNRPSNALPFTAGTFPPQISTLSLPGDSVGIPYGTSLTATGGSDSYSWSATGLPSGLSLNSSSGLISGTTSSTSGSPFTVTVTVTDTSTEATTSQSFQLTVAPSAPTITTTSLPSGTEYQAYMATVSATGGSFSYSWSLSTTELALNLSIDASGKITGTPAASGTYPVTVTVTDTVTSQTATQSFSLTIQLPMSQPSGTSAYVLTQNSLVGITAGVQTEIAGLGEDCNPCSDMARDASGNFVIATGYGVVTISPAGNYIASLYSGEDSSYYASVAVDTDGNYVVADTGLNQLLRFSPDGESSTTVGKWSPVYPYEQAHVRIAANGNYVLAIGSSDDDDDNSFQLFVASASAQNIVLTPLALTPSPSPGPVPQSASGLTFDGGGNYVVVDPTTTTFYSITSSGSVSQFFTDPTDLPSPIGIYRDPASGNYFVGDEDSDAVYALNPNTSQLSLVAGGGYLDPGPTAIIAADTSSPVTQDWVLESLDGSAELLNLSNGTTLTCGEDLCEDGASDFTTDHQGNFVLAASNSSLINVAPAGVASAIPISPPDTEYPPYYFSVAVDASGNYIVADDDNHQILQYPAAGGSPAKVWTYCNDCDEEEHVYVRVDAFGNYVVVEDNEGRTPISVFLINPATTPTTGTLTPLALTGYTLPATDIGGLTLDAAGNYVVPDSYNAVVYSITPAGAVSLLYNNTDDGETYAVLSSPVGLARDTGSNRILIADNEYDALYLLHEGSGSIDFVAGNLNNPISVLSVPTSLTITTTLLPIGTVGVPYAPLTVAAQGGSGNYTWTATGLPSPLSISSAGVISGTPATATSGLVMVTLMATDTTTSATASLMVPLEIDATAPGTLTITTTSLPNGTQGMPYSATLSATGGSGNYKWEILSDADGLNLSVNASTGALTGVPALSGALGLSVRVTDTITLQSQTADISVSIGPGAPPLDETGYVLNEDGSIVELTSAGAFPVTNVNPNGDSCDESDNCYFYDMTKDSAGRLIVPFGGGIAVVNSGMVTTPVTLSSDTSSSYESAVFDSSVSPGNFIVADIGQHELLKISADGSTTTVIGTWTPSLPYIYDAYVRIDGTGNYILATDSSDDEGNVAFQLFQVLSSTTGATLTPLPLTGSPLPRSTGGLTFDASGKYIDVDWDQDAVFTISASGAVSELFSDPNRILSDPLGIFYDAGSTNYFLTDDDNDAVYTLSEDGSTLTQIASGSAFEGGPSAAVVADSAPPPVSRDYVLETGDETVIVPLGGSANLTCGYSICPDGALDFAADAQGNFILAGMYSKLAKVTPSGVASAIGVSLSGGFSDSANFSSVAVDSAGNYVVADTGNNTIWAFNPTSGSEVLNGGNGASFTPRASGGNAYVRVDAFGNYVLAYDNSLEYPFQMCIVAPGTGTCSAIALSPGVDLQTHASLDAIPYIGLGGFTFDANGNYILTDREDALVYMVTPTGVVNRLYDNTSESLSAPAGIYRDPISGNYLIADYDNDALMELNAAGNLVSTVADYLYGATAVISLPTTLTITSSYLPGGTMGMTYGPLDLMAQGGSGNYTWSATGLPAGLSISSAGVIGGTPTAAVSGTSVMITVTDTTTSATATQTLTLSITGTVTPLSITTTSLPNGQVGVSYSATVTASGGSSSYSWSATGLPSGLTISTSGLISGTPTTETSSASVTVTVMDTVTSATASMTYTMSIAYAPLHITTTALPSGIVNLAYGPFSMTASGGSASYSWSATGLPSPLTMSAAGIITGTPGAVFTGSVMVTLTDTTTSLTAMQTFSFADLQNFTIDFPNFSTVSSLTINGNAAQVSSTQDGSVVRLTPALEGQAGSAFYTTSVPFEAAGDTFSTFFQFRIGNPGVNGPGDGLIFALQSSSSGPAALGPLAADGGTGKGYYGIAPSIGIAFETYPESGYLNDVFLVENGSVTPIDPSSAGDAGCGSPTGVAGCLANGDVWSAWVDYDGTNMHVAVADNSTLRPADLIDTPVNVSSVLGAVNSLYAGFTAAAGLNDENHDIVNWVYNNTYNPIVPPRVTTTTLVPGTSGAAYGPLNLSATGGSGVYSWTATSTLPAGLTLTGGGILSGTPTVAGTFTVTVNVTDSGNNIAISHDYSLTIAGSSTGPPPTSISISTTSLPNGTYNHTYGPATLTATGGSGSYSWSISGVPGLTVNASTGALGGAPTAVGSQTLTATVTDGSSAPVSASFTIAVTYPSLVITSSVPTTGMVDQPYGPATLTATGGSGAGYTWSGSGIAGVSVSSSGVVSGTPTTPGNFSLSVTVTDSTAGLTTTSTYSVTIAAAPLSITTTSLPAGTAAVPYGPFTLAASGGTGTYTWSGSGTPPGVSVSSSGSVGGTPTAGGTFTVMVTVTDQAGKTASASFSVTITAAPVTISGSGSLGGFVPGASVSGSYSGKGGTPPYTFTATGLPSSLSLTSAGALSGTAPPSPGTYTFSVTVSDSETPPQTASTNTSLSVLGFLSSSLPSGSAGTPYSGSVSATGGTPPYSFSASGVPAGLSFASSGFVSGTPTAAGSFTLTVQLSDSGGLTVSGSFGITIASGAQPVEVTGASLPTGSVQASYTQTLQANNGQPPYTWTILGGSLPPGLALSSGGNISGTPTAIGTSSFTAQATDSTGGFASAAFSIVVSPAVLMVNAASLPDGIATAPYPGQIITASGGTPPYTFALTSGSLPPGLSFSNGEIVGIPTTAATTGFTITVTDSAMPPQTASGEFSMGIDPLQPALVLAQGSVSFALSTGATALPAGAAVPVRSSITTDVLSYSVTPPASAPWLSVSAGGGLTPDTIGISLTAAALSLTPNTYSASIAVNCIAPSPSPCAGTSQTIGVTLTVSSPAPQLSVSTTLLSFSATNNSATQSQPLSLTNTGGGVIAVDAVTAADPWVSVSGVPSTIAAGVSVPVTVTVNPAGLAANYYESSITISTSAGSATVQVALLVATSPTLTLNPAGTQFLALQGSAPGNTGGSFLVSVSGSSTVNWVASVMSGGDTSWLTLNTASGSSTSANPGMVSYSINPSVVAGLAAQSYYATIEVTSGDVVDGLVNYQIVLNVSPTAGTAATPDPEPAGEVFIDNGTGTVPPQSVAVYTSSATAVAYQASSDSPWLAVSPSTGTTSSAAAGQSTITVTPGTLAAGVYRGNISYAISSATSRSVNVTLIVEAVGGTTPASTGHATVSSLSPAQSSACTANLMVPTQTGLVNNFAQPTAWPTPLTISLMDDCGSPITNGQVVTTFTNGDPPLVLQAVGSSSGQYTGTWTPRSSSPQVTITARATAPGFTAATIQIAGQVTPNPAPILNPNGTINAFVPTPGSPLAPGMIVQIYGANMAAQQLATSTVPLTTSIGNTSVLIGGVEAPLYFVSPGQINAQVPFELAPGTPYQVLVNANGALSTPVSIQMGLDQPGIASLANGEIIAQHANGTLVTDASPAMPGEYIVFYVAGMGATTTPVASGQPSPSNPVASTLDTPTLTLNGVNVPIYFAGLTPTFVGLYQVNFQVPVNTPNGDLQLILTQTGGQSNATILAVHN